MGRARRLNGFNYIGRYSYFLTVRTFKHVRWFENDQDTRRSVAQLLRTSHDYQFEVVAYCFMPDHLHALVEGLSARADVCRFVSMFKQRSAFEHRLRRSGRLWQEGYYDRVIRRGESVLSVAAYIFANPWRAGICKQFGEYPYMASSRYTVEQLRAAAQVSPTV